MFYQLTQDGREFLVQQRLDSSLALSKLQSSIPQKVSLYVNK